MIRPRASLQRANEYASFKLAALFLVTSAAMIVAVLIDASERVARPLDQLIMSFLG